MSTYSINISSPFETTSYFLTGDLGTGSNFELLLDRLPDNLDKLIEPRDIRDTMLSLRDSVVFKQTSGTSSIDYVGIDAADNLLSPSDRDLNKKMLFGKRSFSGTFSYTDSQTIHIMDGLNTDTDIFIYNTKGDTQQQLRTRVQLISGTDYQLNTQMPYIQSQVVSGVTTSLSFDFFNRLGEIKYESENNNVSLNSITFSTINQYTSQISNNKFLVWDGNQLVFDELLITSTVGSQSESLFISGNPVNVNGFPIEFQDSRKSSFQTGDITLGSTFNNDVSIEEMLRRIIYDYLPPTSGIRILPPFNTGYVEIGSFPPIILEWSIRKKTLPTLQTSLTNMIPGIYPPILNNEYETVIGQSNGIVISPVGATSTTFQITVSDGTQLNTSGVSVEGVYPYFWGFSQLTTMTTIGLQSLEKYVDGSGDKEVQILGSGNFFFVYPESYVLLSDILDENNISIISSFIVTNSQNFTSPTGLWAGQLYRVYKIENFTQNNPVNWTFVV